MRETKPRFGCSLCMDQDEQPRSKAKRGFAAMSPEKRREIARKGGAAVPNEKRSFSQSHDLAAKAGRKGGERSHGGGRRSAERDPG